MGGPPSRDSRSSVATTDFERPFAGGWLLGDQTRQCRAGPDGRRRGRHSATTDAKLLDLYYKGKISEDFFHEEETRLATAIEAVRHEATALSEEVRTQTDMEARFEELAALLSTLDIETLWDAAEDHEKRVIIENMVESVIVYPDHLEIKVVGSPALHVLYSEVGLKGSENVQVGGQRGDL